MIKEIFIRGSYKANWIDQNKVVFGYDNERECCEEFRWGVFNADGISIAENPDGMPYHFDFKAGALEHFPEDWSTVTIDMVIMSMFGFDHFTDMADVVVVKLIPDDDNGSPLYFICINDHNGYYYHDFSFDCRKEEEA